MKNYYEILEIDKKASSEVIEKAYRTLVKKYHPDLQNGNMQKEYEEKMKKINEAYSILSDEQKRQLYDENLLNIDIQPEEYERVKRENQELKIKLDEMITEIQNKNQTSNYERIKQNQEEYQVGNTISNMGKIMQEEIKQAYNNAYRDAYIQDMKNRGYKIRYKHDIKYYMKLVIYILVVILIFIIIYQIPIVKRFFLKVYEENLLIKAIVDVFKNTFSTKPW